MRLQQPHVAAAAAMSVRRLRLRLDPLPLQVRWRRIKGVGKFIERQGPLSAVNSAAPSYAPSLAGDDAAVDDLTSEEQGGAPLMQSVAEE